MTESVVGFLSAAFIVTKTEDDVSKMETTSGQEMLAMLPPYYDTVNTKALLDTKGKEFDALKALLLFVLDQLFVISASSWGLDWWEKELGLTTIAGKPDEERRSRILSKLRGVSTVTINLIQDITAVYENGRVDFIDHPEDYYFIIKFIDTLGLPPNLADLQSAIEDVKPAHLEALYEFTYTTYGDLKSWGLSYGDMKAHTYGALKTYRQA